MAEAGGGVASEGAGKEAAAASSASADASTCVLCERWVGVEGEGGWERGTVEEWTGADGTAAEAVVSMAREEAAAAAAASFPPSVDASRRLTEGTMEGVEGEGGWERTSVGVKESSGEAAREEGKSVVTEEAGPLTDEAAAAITGECVEEETSVGGETVGSADWAVEAAGRAAAAAEASGRRRTRAVGANPVASSPSASLSPSASSWSCMGTSVPASPTGW